VERILAQQASASLPKICLVLDLIEEPDPNCSSVDPKFLFLCKTNWCPRQSW